MQLVISAAGKNFCAGLDLSYLTDTFGTKMQQQSDSSSSCPARMRYAFRQDILQMQVRELLALHTATATCSPSQHQPGLQLWHSSFYGPQLAPCFEMMLLPR